MIDGIASDKQVVEILKQKTGLSEEVIKNNIKYINKRVLDLLDNEEVHMIRLSGLGVLLEDYNRLVFRTLPPFRDKSKIEYFTKKAKHLKSILDTYPIKQVKKFYSANEFLRRKRFKITDEELEKIQNE